jgi:hypothetical protein
MKFEQPENLGMNKLVDKVAQEDDAFNTREDFIAFCVKNELKVRGVLK